MSPIVDTAPRTAEALHADRIERVMIQVWARWTNTGAGLDEVAENETMDRARQAVKDSFTERTCDLDWEAAALRRLGYTGLVL